MLPTPVPYGYGDEMYEKTSSVWDGLPSTTKTNVYMVHVEGVTATRWRPIECGLSFSMRNR